MEYGIWQMNNKSGSYHTMSMCRHHGIQEFSIAVIDRNGHNYIKKECLLCGRLRHKGHKTGNIPGCANFTGVHIAENILSKAFGTMIRAPIHAPYDFICGKGLKIDSKCSVLSKHGTSVRWIFHINKNTTSNVFCLIALDNSIDNVAITPKPLYVWLVPGNDTIENRKVNDRTRLSVSPNTVHKLDAYRRTDMEGKIIKCCNSLK